MNELLIRALSEIEKDAIRFAVKQAMNDFAGEACSVAVKEVYVHEVWTKYQEHKLAILTGSIDKGIVEGIERVDKANREG